MQRAAWNIQHETYNTTGAVGPKAQGAKSQVSHGVALARVQSCKIMNIKPSRASRSSRSVARSCSACEVQHAICCVKPTLDNGQRAQHATCSTEDARCKMQRANYRPRIESRSSHRSADASSARCRSARITSSNAAICSSKLKIERGNVASWNSRMRVLC